MKICVAGEGAFGNKHLEALARIEGVEVVSLVGGVADATAAAAKNTAFRTGRSTLPKAWRRAASRPSS